jgi:hypothetical protein
VGGIFQATAFLCGFELKALTIPWEVASMNRAYSGLDAFQDCYLFLLSSDSTEKNCSFFFFSMSCSFLNEKGVGIDVYFHMKKLNVRTNQHNKIVIDYSFEQRKWYHLVLVHSYRYSPPSSSSPFTKESL